MFVNGVISDMSISRTQIFSKINSMWKNGNYFSQKIKMAWDLQQISYARSENEYQFHVEKLKATKLNSVVDYFMENWDTLKLGKFQRSKFELWGKHQ